MRRRNVHVEVVDDDNGEEQESQQVVCMQSDDLNIMEQILLLGLKEKEGYTPAFNESISFTLRAAIVLELGFIKRIQLKAENRPIQAAKIIVISKEPTGDALLDEALNIMSTSPTCHNITTWIEYLNGDSWNPFKMVYQLRNVRDRIAKGLSEKGICSVVNQNFIFFDSVTHPVINRQPKKQIYSFIQNGLLHKWQPDIHKMAPRLLALIILTNTADVLDDALNNLQDAEYTLVIKRLNKIVSTNFQELISQETDPCLTILWSVILAIQ